MALIKDIALANGVTVKYHRVVRIEGFPGVQTNVEVASYCSADGRAAEKAAREAPSLDAPAPYISTSYFHCDYVDGMTVGAAYAYLLSQPEFAGAASDEGVGAGAQ